MKVRTCSFCQHFVSEHDPTTGSCQHMYQGSKCPCNKLVETTDWEDLK